MFGLGLPDIVLILAITVVIFGASKIPDIGKALEKKLSGLKKDA